VVGTPPHGLDGLGDIPVAGDDDDGDVRVLLPEVGDPVQAIPVRELEVQKDGSEAPVGQGLTGFTQGGHAVGHVPDLGQVFRQQAPDVGVVVDDEDVQGHTGLSDI
jgi:hypothetical protein